MDASAAPPEPVSGELLIADARFADGGALPELRQRYTTLGALRRDAAGRAANAVLLLHGTGGSGAAFLRPQFAGALFGPGQPLDARRRWRAAERRGRWRRRPGPLAASAG